MTKESPELPEFIGTATMLEDGTIVLHLRAQDDEMLGHGQISYKPEQKEYQEVLAHIGEIAPGESKPVRPWD